MTTQLKTYLLLDGETRRLDGFKLTNGSPDCKLCGAALARGESEVEKSHFGG
jgi:hypothetical protein